jgi:hypothetical protein
MHLESLLLNRAVAKCRGKGVERSEGQRGRGAGDGVVPCVRGWDGAVREDVRGRGAGEVSLCDDP